MNMTDELATWISNGDVAFFSRIWTRSGLIRGDPKFGQGLGMSLLYRWSASVCMGWLWLHVNWLHVSRIRPTHWRLNDDFDINQRRRRLTRNIRIGVCMWVAASLLDSSTLSLAACTALAEIGRRNPLPLRDSQDDQSDQLTTSDQMTTTDQSVEMATNPVTTDQLTIASVVTNLINKVKSTSENAKVSYTVCLHARTKLNTHLLTWNLCHAVYLHSVWTWAVVCSEPCHNCLSLALALELFFILTIKNTKIVLVIYSTKLNQFL